MITFNLQTTYDGRIAIKNIRRLRKRVMYRGPGQRQQPSVAAWWGMLQLPCLATCYYTTDYHNKKPNTRKAMEHWNAAKTISFLIRSPPVTFLIPISKSEDLISTQCTSLLRTVASMQYFRLGHYAASCASGVSNTVN